MEKTVQPSVQHAEMTRDDTERRNLQRKQAVQPPSSHLAQLAALANGSPQVAAQRRIAEVAQGSPAVAAQFKMSEYMNHGAPVQAKTEDQPNRTGLPDNLKSGVEGLSGISLDNVKVHYNSGKPAQLNALAYAQGTDIHVAPGQEKHLPHEAWHIVQQAQGRVKPTLQMKRGVPVNDDPALEHEADVMGMKAVQLKDCSREAAPALQNKSQLDVVQGAFINNGNNAAAYPHLHTDGQFIGYTIAAGGNQLELRTNGGAIRHGWFQDLGIAIGGNLSAARRAHHDAILNWIRNNEPDVWAERR